MVSRRNTIAVTSYRYMMSIKVYGWPKDILTITLKSYRYMMSIKVYG